MSNRPRKPIIRVATESEETSVLEAARAATSEQVAPVGSTGLPALEPLVTVAVDGRTEFYTACSRDRTGAIASGLADGELPEADATVESEGKAGLPLPEEGPLAVGRRDVLAGCGWRRPTEPEDYRAAGGFVGVDSDGAGALAAADGLAGRGWGDSACDSAVADHWEDVADADGDPAVVVNAHGTESDRLLVDGDPFAVLDGAALAANAVGARDAYVYVSEADERALDHARTAADRFPGDLAVDVVAGPATYKAAEPTMAIEAIEGSDRLEARVRPPGPERSGLHGRPTLVHTARTLAHVATRARESDERERGDEGERGDESERNDERERGVEGDHGGTRLVTVTGDVAHEATVELAADDTLATALEATTVDGEFKAACVGGRFGGLTDTLDVGVTPGALSAANLGTEGVVEVLNADRCPVEFVGKRTKWAADTNCGRCVPCREGSIQLAELLREVYDGTYDVEGIEELTRVVAESSICRFGRDLPRPVRTAMDAFAEEFQAHADGRCPSGVCTEAMEATH